MAVFASSLETFVNSMTCWTRFSSTLGAILEGILGMMGQWTPIQAKCRVPGLTWNPGFVLFTVYLSQ